LLDFVGHVLVLADLEGNQVPFSSLLMSQMFISVRVW
jgi:hypothetical protein